MQFSNQAAKTYAEAAASNLSPSGYTSPLLSDLPAHLQPSPYPACATCPAALWQLSDADLICFCRQINIVTYPQPRPVLKCDGRTFAILQLSE